MLLQSERWIGGFLLFALCRVVHGQRVKVRDEVTGYVGQEVTLQCIFNRGTDTSIKVSQVTWVKNTEGKKASIAVYHPDHGPSYPLEGPMGRFMFQAPTLQDASLVIKSLKMSDEGIYTCEFATYPNGNEEAETKLILLAEPKNSAEAIPVTANDTLTTVATCISADGRPPSRITWQSSLSGNVSTSQTNNTDGTVTVTSQYKTVPTSYTDGQRVTCVINHKTSKEPFTIPVTLSVQYPPEVTIEGYDDDWYISRSQADLKCIAKGNPPPTNFHWSSTNGPLPSTVEVINNLLVVKTVDDLVNTTFICQVTNAVGTSSSQLKVLVRDGPQTSAVVSAPQTTVAGLLVAPTAPPETLPTVLVPCTVFAESHGVCEENDDTQIPDFSPDLFDDVDDVVADIEEEQEVQRPEDTVVADQHQRTTTGEVQCFQAFTETLISANTQLIECVDGLRCDMQQMMETISRGQNTVISAVQQVSRDLNAVNSSIQDLVTEMRRSNDLQQQRMEAHSSSSSTTPSFGSPTRHTVLSRRHRVRVRGGITKKYTE